MKSKYHDDPKIDPLKCYKCNLYFSTPEKVKSHIENGHNIEMVHKMNKIGCDKCDQVFTDRFYLKAHFVNVHERIHICSFCKLNFTTPERLENHIKITHSRKIVEKVKVGIFKCLYCEMEFELKNYLNKHVKSDHECGFCMKYFSTVELKNHNNKIHKCETCNKLVKDLNSHKDVEFNYECPKCDISFTTPEQLKDHIKGHTPRTQQKPTQNRDLWYRCGMCDYACSEASILEKHKCDKTANEFEEN